MAAWGYEFYLLVLKVSLTRSRSSVYFIDTDEIPTSNTTFFKFTFKQQNSAINACHKNVMKLGYKVIKKK